MKTCMTNLDLVKDTRVIAEPGSGADRLHLQHRQLSRMVEQTNDTVMITDCEGNTEYVNQAFTTTTGYSSADMIQQNPGVLKSGAHDETFYRRLWNRLLSGQVFRADFVNRRKDGSLFHEDKTIMPLQDEHGRITHFVAVGRDIGNRVRAHRRMLRLAYYDSLTGLPNRTLLLDRLNHALKRLQRRQGLMAVMFLDLDCFKMINDTLGHDVGDQVIKSMAIRLRRCVRDGDSIARLGGDEFVIVLEDVAHKNEITATAEKIIVALAEPYTFGDQRLITTASIGITLAPHDGNRVNQLLRNADQAMYQAKGDGGCRHAFFGDC